MPEQIDFNFGSPVKEQKEEKSPKIIRQRQLNGGKITAEEAAILEAELIKENIENEIDKIQTYRR